MVCKLNTRCSILAACNVKGEIEEGKTISANLALASPLLSRFDLIFLLLDRKREESWDSELCDRLLSGVEQDKNKVLNDSCSYWEFDELKMYIAFVRTQLNPKMGKLAELVLSRYYQLQRRSDSMKSARTTVRMLESLVRLAQSHAKLMFHGEVQLKDAMMAVLLVEASLISTQTLQCKIDLHAPEIGSAEEYAQWYERIEKEMLYKLEINKANLESDCVEENESQMSNLDELLLLNETNDDDEEEENNIINDTMVNSSFISNEFMTSSCTQL